MPLQNFKSVYFPDLPSDSARRQNITLAFGAADEAVYQAVRYASSAEIRDWLGHDYYSHLERTAERERRSINAYCLLRLEKAVASADSKCRASQGKISPVATDPGLLATFRGGEPEPLHHWFPYLEGFSPAFVRHVLASFAPKAERVFDPFGGIGTTPLTAARLHKQSFYCELNPLLQLITAAKARALSSPSEDRDRAAVWLEAAAARFAHELHAVQPDRELSESYQHVFGESIFFDAPVLDLLLRARTLLDRWRCEYGDVASCAELAVLATIVPVSRLVRRGDLRFKNAVEMRKQRPDLVFTVRERMQRISNDLRRVEAIEHPPVLLSDDARLLERVPSAECDAVVTSPPYLNGTNYFRNTKPELWFLRCLRSPADLAGFRARAVTAGINDVTVAKLRDGIPPEARDVVESLSRKAYDQRIPAMAANYFADMASVAEGVVHHLRKNAVFALDIGDSAYGGIHVPTDKVLIDIFRSRGLHLRRDVTLRRRASRGGRLLRQALLVFQFRPRAATRTRETLELSPQWLAKWQRFKSELPHQRGFFCKRNWGHRLHSLCSYQGKMKPALAHFLLKTFCASGDTILDPFAGVGTIPFEGALMAMKTWSFDISPAAIHIARAKLGLIEPSECEAELHDLSQYLSMATVNAADVESAAAIRFNGPLRDYFSPRTFENVLKARRYYLDHPPRTHAASLVYACLLHILHGNRPYALSRRSHPITPFAPSGPAEYRDLMSRLREKVERSLLAELPHEFVPGEVLNQDACGWWPATVANLDAIVTSPPFYDSTRFYLANWMRLWFCGWEAEDFRVRPLGFVDERQKKSFAVYEPLFRQARERLKESGVLVLHLGRSRKCDMAEHLKYIARKWFRVVDIFTEQVGHCESHGIRDKGTVTAHQFLVLN